MPEPTPGGGNGAAALEISRLEVRYGTVPATLEVNIRVHPGEVVGLIGPNGAGKSTTLAAVMGLVRPHRGDILLQGRSIVGLPPDQIARMGIAMVPEGRQIYGAFSVEENLRLGMLGRARNQEPSDTGWVFELFPVVKEFASRRAGDLSGGQQQQLAIARALVSDPEILLLDEPSLGLAPSVVEQLFSALDLIRRKGVTVLLVEQRAELTVAFADRTHVMRDGRLVLDLSPEDASDTEKMTSAYFGT